jgi:nucleoid-associated protein YgaU
MTMRTPLILALSLAIAVIGCQKAPDHQVEVGPPPEPEATDQAPQLTEIRPVDSGLEEEEGSQGPPTLTEATEGQAYTVRKGDTFWNIASKKLGNGHRWKEIAAMNPGVDANKLRVGQTIRIPLK